MIAIGGKTIYGAPLGVLMLESRFPRLPGDVGHAASWPAPPLFRVVRGASPRRVVRGDAEGLFDAFVEAGRALIDDGAQALITSCGFLSPLQDRLAEAVGAPVAVSALSQVAWLDALLPRGRRAGVLTIDAAALTPAHLVAAGAPADAPLAGTEGGAEFTRAILGDEPRLDVEAARADVVAAARALAAARPDLGAIVLECANMGPFAADVVAATGRPAYGIVELGTWLQAGLAPVRRPPAG